MKRNRICLWVFLKKWLIVMFYVLKYLTFRIFICFEVKHLKRTNEFVT